MAKSLFRIFKVPDKELIDGFIAVSQECLKSDDGFNLQLSLGAGHQKPLNGTISKLRNDEAYNAIVLMERSIFLGLFAKYSALNNASISINREPGSDSATVSFQDSDEPLQVATFLAAVHRHFRVYERTPEIDKLLGDELAEFYRRREEGLLKLEGLTQSLIERNNEYCKRLDIEKEEYQKTLIQEYENKTEALEQTHQGKVSELSQKETDLNVRAKEIDDRESKHARRQIRKDLKKALADRAETFNLTTTTTRKRIPNHILFILLLLGSASVVGHTLYITNFLEGGFEWWSSIRLALGTFTFFASIGFYIRWNDKWFRQHADEEFLLKRLELDIDRASWVVEMALEWKEEEGRELPDQLIERLTENLFASPSDSGAVKHPTEDLTAALMASAAGITVNLPGVGEMKVDRKGIKDFIKRSTKNPEA